MAGLKLDIEYGLGSIRQLINVWGSLRAEFMHKIGKQARLTLKGQLLSGQELTMNRDQNKKGFDNIRSRVGNGANSVSVTSPLTNLFERGRTLRSGRKEPAKRIITSKLKTLVDANMGSYVSKAEKDIERAAEKA